MEERLKELRVALGMTQAEVAAKLGITTRAYSYYETGTREPSLDVLKSFCRFFDVSADYLLGLTEY